MTEITTPYGPAPRSYFESQYNRVLEIAECRTQVELAAVLEVRQSSISDAKRRQFVPPDWLMTLFEKKRTNPEWIRLGIGAKYLDPAETAEAMPHMAKVVEVRPPQECSAQDLFNELVRRALQQPDITAIQKQVADSWLPMNETGDKS